MSVAEILEAFHWLSEAERCELVAYIENELFGYTDELTPAQITELERRAGEFRKNPRNKMLWEAIREEFFERSKVKPPPDVRPFLKPYFSAVKALPFLERTELAHRLWDEFMGDFPDWKAAPPTEGEFGWQTLKLEIDAMLDSADRLELAQQVWKNIQESGHDPRLTPEQVAELDHRTAEAGINPVCSRAFEEVFAEIRGRSASSQELKSGEATLIGRRLLEHLKKTGPVVSSQEAKSSLDEQYGK